MLTKLHGSMSSQMNNTLGINFGVAAFVALIILLVIHLAITKWLWNNVLVQLVPSIKKATSMWQLFGLTILMSFIIPK